MVAAIKKFPPKVAIDASVALAFLLADEEISWPTSLFQQLSQNKIKIIVPQIFYFEVGNGLRSAVLRKRLEASLAKKLFKNFLILPIKQKKVSWTRVFALALKKKLSFYDAAYLVLAKQEKVKLLSLDKRLVNEK